MNGDEQRPSGGTAEAQSQHDAPEPGNARLPQTPQQQGQNGQPQGEGGSRRRFRRQRRGGRGRGRRNQHGQQQVQPPLDAQGRIVDVENDEGGDEVPQPGDPQAAVAAGEPMGSQTGADIAGGPSAPGAPTPPVEGNIGPAPQPQHARPQQQPQQRQQRQQRQEPTVPCEGVLD